VYISHKTARGEHGRARTQREQGLEWPVLFIPLGTGALSGQVPAGDITGDDELRGPSPRESNPSTLLVVVGGTARGHRKAAAYF